MCQPNQLLKLTTDQLVQLQHDAHLELLRRFPPTWPHMHVYNVARRLFDATRELHQAIEQAQRPDDHQPNQTYPGLHLAHQVDPP